MLICPNCQAALYKDTENHICKSCKWCSSRTIGVEQFMSDADRADPTFSSYLANYDVIADDDLASSIMDEEYVKYLASQTANLLTYSKNMHVCDVGIGKGFLTNEMLNLGAQKVTAVDISLDFLKRMIDTEGVSPVQANAENLPFHEEFDAVVSTDVLEHVLNVGSFLISVNRALKINGSFVVRVPNCESLLKYSPHYGCKYRFVHLRSFNLQLLSTMLKDAGFEVVQHSYDGYWLDIPRSYWKKPGWRTVLLEKFKAWVLDQTSGNPHKVSFLRYTWLLRIFLMPVELTCSARKIQKI